MDHDIAIVGYYAGSNSASPAVVVTPAVGTLSESLHTRAAVQDFIGGASPAYYAAAAILSHVNPTSIHVLSLGDPRCAGDGRGPRHISRRTGQYVGGPSPRHLLMPGIAGKVDGTAMAVADITIGTSNAYDDPDNVLVDGAATVADTLYAAMDAYANAVNGIAILEVPGSTVDNAFAFATLNKRANTLLVGNPMRFIAAPPTSPARWAPSWAASWSASWIPSTVGLPAWTTRRSPASPS